MKAYFSSLLITLGLMVSTIAPALAGDRQHLQNFNQDLATNTAFTMLSAITGVTYRIQGVELSTDVEGTYTLRCGAATVKGKWSLSKNGGFLVEYINVNKTCLPGEGVFIDKPSNANTYAYIWYDRR